MLSATQPSPRHNPASQDEGVHPTVHSMAQAIIRRTNQGETVTRLYLAGQGFTRDEIDRHIEDASAKAGRELASCNRSDD
jgi:hypothetical protein